MTWFGRRMLLGASAFAVPLAGAVMVKNNENQGLDTKIRKANELVKTYMAINGIPGLSVAVSVDGKIVWKSGFGFANLENGARCTGDSVMRIASISKPITATIAARLVEDGKLNLDSDIRNYLPEFPAKKFRNEDVTLTMRQLLSHTAGIRHYRNPEKDPSLSLEDPANNNTKTAEFLSNVYYPTSIDALSIFKNDDLISKPGSRFAYTTFGLTLAGAVLEKSAGKTYRQLADQLFADLGMKNTQLDTKERIVGGRVSYYRRNSKKVLENCPEVDNSNKFAGGGLISNVSDLLVFANAILLSTQSESNDTLLKTSTIRKFLVEHATMDDGKTKSGLGWFLVKGSCIKSIEDHPTTRPYFYHTGAAVGASSILLIRPDEPKNEGKVSGVCVAILCNVQETSVSALGRAIADLF